MGSHDCPCETESQISVVPVIVQASRNGDLKLVTCLSSGQPVSVLLKKIVALKCISPLYCV